MDEDEDEEEEEYFSSHRVLDVLLYDMTPRSRLDFENVPVFVYFVTFDDSSESYEGYSSSSFSRNIREHYVPLRYSTISSRV